MLRFTRPTLMGLFTKVSEEQKTDVNGTVLGCVDARLRRFPSRSGESQALEAVFVERDKVYRIVEERNLASLANNSRWTAFFSQLSSHRMPARLKHIAWSKVSEWSVWIIPVPHYLEVVAAGPVHFREIEWVEFDCAERGCDVCTATARKAKLTSEVFGQIVRVIGYHSAETSSA